MHKLWKCACKGNYHQTPLVKLHVLLQIVICISAQQGHRMLGAKIVDGWVIYVQLLITCVIQLICTIIYIHVLISVLDQDKCFLGIITTMLVYGICRFLMIYELIHVECTCIDLTNLILCLSFISLYESFLKTNL